SRAPDHALVPAAELHTLWDADFASAQFFWPRRHSIWALSTISALGPGGKMAEGARPIEALRILYDLDMRFDNLRSARERIRRGVLASEELRKRMENQSQAPSVQSTFTVRVSAGFDRNPVHAAELRYIQQHGLYVLNGVVEKLFDELF